MTSPMTREQEIQNEALTVTYGGLQNDPFFYAAKQNMRRNLSRGPDGKRCPPPVLIEFAPEHVTVIDNDLTVHVI